MPGCAAVGCSNSSEKGFLMKRFPRDPIRRKEWADRTKRTMWFPTNSSVLCEVHFEPEMWEVTREDGSRRLKANAVPSIFSFTKFKPRKCNKRKKLADNSEILINTVVPLPSFKDVPEIVTNYAIPSTSSQTMEIKFACKNIDNTLPGISAENIYVEHSYANLESVSVETSISQSSWEPSKIINDTSSSSENPNAVFENLTRKETEDWTVLKKKKFLLLKYKNKLRYANNKVKYLEKKLKNVKELTRNEETMILHKLFRKDQITALKKKSRNISTKFMKWSDETVTNALQLIFHCGSSGYEELLKQNLPFPSVRTLQRKLIKLI